MRWRLYWRGASNRDFRVNKIKLTRNSSRLGWSNKKLSNHGLRMLMHALVAVTWSIVYPNLGYSLYPDFVNLPETRKKNNLRRVSTHKIFWKRVLPTQNKVDFYTSGVILDNWGKYGCMFVHTFLIWRSMGNDNFLNKSVLSITKNLWSWYITATFVMHNILKNQDGFVSKI